jgi:hypothetical protein
MKKIKRNMLPLGERKTGEILMCQTDFTITGHLLNM